MTISYTRNTTFTITDARQIASKMGADLRNLNIRTGHPALIDIPDYVEEAAQHLKNGYLESVSFGFKSGDRWMLRLRYQALESGTLSDGAPGGLPNVTVTGYPFYSYLRRSQKFKDLPASEQSVFLAGLPIQRVGATEPSAIAGTSANGTTYARNGVGLGRDIFRAS